MLAGQPNSNSELLVQWETVSGNEEEIGRGKYKYPAWTPNVHTRAHINTLTHAQLKRRFIECWEVPIQMALLKPTYFICVKMTGSLSQRDNNNQFITKNPDNVDSAFGGEWSQVQRGRF